MNVVPERPQRPPAIGSRFHSDGSVCRFRGNAVLCHLTTGNPAFAAVVSIQRALQDDIFAKRFAFLPPASLHMPLLEGAREPEAASWPADCIGRSLDEVTAAFAERLKSIDAPSGFRMRPKELRLDHTSGSVIRLLPWDSAEQRKVANFRKRLADILQLPAANTEGTLDIALSYLLDWPTVGEANAIERAHSALTAHLARALSVLEFGRAELCRYENMLYFERMLYVGTRPR
jgi:hypothetical protein